MENERGIQAKNMCLKINTSKYLYFALTLKKMSFLFLLKYKAESILAGILAKRLGKPWSSLKPVYLHTLSSVKEQVESEKGIKHCDDGRSFLEHFKNVTILIHLSENMTCQCAESEQLHSGSLAAPSTVQRSGWDCCSQSWTPSTRTDH